MIAFPFVYFSIWFIVEFRKRGLDAYTFIILLYTIISFFAILIDVMDLYYNHSCVKYPSLGLIAPVLYVVLLTICIKPFSRVTGNTIQKLAGGISERKFNLVVYAYFTMFLIVFAASLTRIQEILLSNALAEVRNEAYQGEAGMWYDSVKGLPRMICGVCHILAPSSFIMIPFFFIGMIHFKKGFPYSALTLLGSLTMLLIAIHIADRSNFVYWGLTFVFCYVLFKHRLSSKTKFYFSILAIIFGVIMLSYFINVTVSRFGEREGGYSGGLIIYAGQSYINFCNFFNHLIFEVPHKPEIVLFPNINRYILNGPTYFEYADQLSLIYSHTVSNFSTFIGLIMSISGLEITILYCLIYNFITRIALWRPSAKHITIRQFSYFWILVLVPLLGLFGYFYLPPNTVLAAFVWWIIGLFLTPKNVHKNV